MRKFYTPKKIIIIFLVSLFMMVVRKSFSDAYGPGTGYTGAPGESNCTSCHTGTTVNGGAYASRLQLIHNITNNQYAVNTTYQLTVRMVTKNCVRFGFEITALNSSNAGAGTLTVTNTNRTQKKTSGSKQYIEHTYNGTSAIYSDSTDFTFNWTSPTTNIGNVTFYLAVNVTNNNSNYTGDTIYTNSFVIQAPSSVPVATITTDKSSVCATVDSVLFIGSGTNNPTQYFWTFPGGTPSTSTSKNLYVKFANAGTPLCSLYVSNSAGTSPTVTKTISVNPSPVSTFTTTGATTFCAGDSVLFTGPSGAGNLYLWHKDGISTGNTNSSYYAKTSGSYTLRLYNSYGCSAFSNPVVVTVNPLPAPLIQAKSNAICAGDSLMLHFTAAAGSTINWYNGANVISNAMDSFYYAKTNGNYSVKVISAAGCTGTSASWSVTVNPLPYANFTVGSSGCLPLLMAVSGSNYRYQWYRNDTVLSNDTAINYTVNINGRFKVKIQNANGCADFSPSITIFIPNLPDVTLTIAGSTTFCAGDSAVLSVPANAQYRYQWFKNGISLPLDTFRTIVIKDSGIYKVHVSNNTCVNISNSTKTSVKAYPDASITASKTSFCEGDSAILNLVNIGSGYSCQWFRNDSVITGANGVKLTAMISGDYHIMVSNGFCARAGSKTFIKVNPTPAIPIITQNKHILTSSTSAAQYQWYKDGVLIPGETYQSLNATQSGIYKVMIKDAKGCSNTSADFNFVFVGIANTISGANNQIRIYPVPVNNALTIETGGSFSGEFFVIDAEGKEIYQGSISDPKINIDTRNWADGIYTLLILVKEKNSTIRFCVSH